MRCYFHANSRPPKKAKARPGKAPTHSPGECSSLEREPNTSPEVPPCSGWESDSSTAPNRSLAGHCTRGPESNTWRADSPRRMAKVRRSAAGSSAKASSRSAPNAVRRIRPDSARPRAPSSACSSSPRRAIEASRSRWARAKSSEGSRANCDSDHPREPAWSGVAGSGYPARFPPPASGRSRVLRWPSGCCWSPACGRCRGSHRLSAADWRSGSR